MLEIERAIESIRSEDWGTRRAGIEVLASLDPQTQEAIPVLIRALRDADWRVRGCAASALARMGQEAKEAIPDLIHLLVEDDVLKCIFIQGDVEQLIFSTQENIQNILVVKKGFPYGYHFKPGENYFVYRNYENEELLFKEKIVVNGNILSLEQEGVAAFTEEANITLFCSGHVTIRSSLETQNLNLKKIKSTNFTMVCSCEKLFNSEELKPGITVDTEDDTVIQASIITDGKLTNKSPTLEVQGSIFCKDLKNKGVIGVTHLDSKSDSVTFFRTTDFKYINRFYVSAIEEVIK